MLNTVLDHVVRPLARLVMRPSVHGAHHVPSNGPVILASNHLSFVDSVVIPLALPRQVTFLAKAEYFEGTGLSGWLSRRFFLAMGHVPVQRGQGRAAWAAVRVAQGVLARGGALAIYPEGTRSLDGRLYRGRTGVARLTLLTGAPVVPVALAGTQRVQPVGSVLPRPYPVTVRFGAPMEFSRYAGKDQQVPVLRAITDEIVGAIRMLSGQEYVNTYHPAVA
ncbi:MAG TPA: lysophospholipid acyltransferase family protein [Pseudonocardiaceae bacterium]|nr:lysophospholipid acyltransferase family protein [Pseudonocardiaceae bacterium]